MPKSTVAGRQQPPPQQYSTASSGGRKTVSSRAISLRPNSFTRRSVKRISGASSRSIKRISGASSRSVKRMSAGVYRVSGAAGSGLGWRHRCLSMPRLPPTILDAGMCDSLLEQQQQQQQSFYAALSPGTRSSGSSQRRRSSVQSPTFRLDPVPEDAPNRHTPASDDDAAPVFTTATMYMHPHRSPYGTQGTTRPKRVSIPTPPTAAPSSCLYQSMGAGLVRQPMYLNAPAVPDLPSNAQTKAAPGFDSDSAAESTAIHSAKEDNGSLVDSRPAYPVDVQRRALATYVLELGIALYSVLVGLALATTPNMRGFFALLVAVCFHQFFEGLALGTSLAELYWVKARLAYEMLHQISTADPVTDLPDQIDNDDGEDGEGPEARTCSDDFEYVSVHPMGTGIRAKSKSRRTLASMATSFTPEPWQVNPNIEHTIEHSEATADDSQATQERPRFLQHRAEPDRFP
ncbi:hypothetical protein EV175_006484, partial [Coemansia sp. RSA 1933]